MYIVHTNKTVHTNVLIGEQFRETDFPRPIQKVDNQIKFEM